MSIKILLFDQSDCPAEEYLEEFFQITLEKAGKIADEVIVVSKRSEKGVKNINFENANAFFQYLSEAPSDTEFLLLNAYAALFDLESTLEMLEEHRRLVFDYSYPENIPAGLLPEIINAAVAPFILRTLHRNTAMFQVNARELFQSDLSSYDSNIYISPVKLAQYRVNFIPDSLSHATIMREIIKKKGTKLKMAELEQTIKEDPLLIRGRPSYYEIQLTTERESGELFAGDFIQKDGYFDFQRLKSLLSEIAAFSYHPSLLFGLYGEPFLHPDIMKIVDLCAEYPEIHFYFESRGLCMDFIPIRKALEQSNVQVLFDLSFNNEKNFAKHKKPVNNMLPVPRLPDLEKAIRALEPKDRVYVQWTRTTINEAELMPFYRKWRDYSIVVQKPDTFGEKHRDLQVVDLAPVKRRFCLHLKNDVLIRYDGVVMLNRYDVDGERSPGNIFTDGLETVWENMGELYARQWEDDFARAADICDCDHWWVFNF